MFGLARRGLASIIVYAANLVLGEWGLNMAPGILAASPKGELCMCLGLLWRAAPRTIQEGWVRWGIRGESQGRGTCRVWGLGISTKN